jgi:hypothetical protein
MLGDSQESQDGGKPLKEMPKETVRIIDLARARGVQLRLMGGLAVRRHCTTLSFCERPYSDIDLMGLNSQSAGIVSSFKELGYLPDIAFNALHGGQRLKFEDHANNRHAEVFLDKFRMDHTLDFRGRLEIDPYTISLTDLFLTKVQVVKLDRKDFHDMFSIFRDHKIGIDDREGVINSRYIAHLCSQDWGLYHTVLKNLERIPDFYDEFKLEKEERDSMDRRIWVLRLMIIEAPKGPVWHARDRLGERLPYYEEVEHIAEDD